LATQAGLSTYFNTLQHTNNTLQHTTAHGNTSRAVIKSTPLLRTNILQNTAEHTVTHCNTLQHTATQAGLSSKAVTPADEDAASLHDVCTVSYMVFVVAVCCSVLQSVAV